MKKINYFFPPKTYFKEYLQFITKIIYYPLKKNNISNRKNILYFIYKFSNIEFIQDPGN